MHPVRSCTFDWRDCCGARSAMHSQKDRHDQEIPRWPPHPGVKPATRFVTGGRDPHGFHGFVNPPVVHASTVLYPTVDDYRGAPRPLYLRPARHAHVGGVRGRAGRDRRAAMRRRGAAAVRAGGGIAGAAVGPPGRRPCAGHRQCLWADPEVLRHRAQPLRRHHHLFRSADQRGIAAADAAEHPRGLSGVAGLALVRGAGRARDRRRRRMRAARSC